MCATEIHKLDVYCRPLFNKQCYYKDNLGSWVVDCSTMRGPNGDDVFHDCAAVALENWVNSTGCQTG